MLGPWRRSQGRVCGVQANQIVFSVGSPLRVAPPLSPSFLNHDLLTCLTVSPGFPGVSNRLCFYFPG